jgi:hypothetical protein
MINSNAGIIDEVFSRNELTYINNYLLNFSKKFTPPVTYSPYTNAAHNFFTTITKDHLLYPWFNKKIFSKISNLTSNNVQMLKGGYLYECTPWKVHSDYYYKISNEPYMAFLIPISVNEDMDQVEKTNTIIFNEEDTFLSTEETNKNWSSKEWDNNKNKKDNNAVPFFEEYLSHESLDNLENLTINKILNWKLGSVLYWDEKLLHCSDNFIRNNISSKQGIVIHTYTV